jgi:hypothetical protein
MISTAGLPSMLALDWIGRERDKFEQSIRDSPVSKREIASFRERVGSIENVDQLQDDYEVYSVVMKAFGLEKQLPAKAMIKKILISDPDDKQSLVNRLTNPAFKELNSMMAFAHEGEENVGDANWRLGSTTWADQMVEMYVDQQFVESQRQVNPTVGMALDFEDKASSMTSWYKVLGDKDVSSFLRVALGLPEALASANIDAQVRAFEEKMDIKDLQDPDVQKSLTRKFAAISDANNAMTQQTSPLLALFSPVTSSGTWSMVTLDVDLVSSFKSNTYI